MKSEGNLLMGQTQILVAMPPPMPSPVETPPQKQPGCWTYDVLNPKIVVTSVYLDHACEKRASVQSNLAKTASPCCIVLYFTMAGTSPTRKCPFSWGSGPHLIHGSLDPLESASQMASRSAKPFLQLTRVPNTPADRQTYRPLRVYALRAGHAD